MKKVWKELSIIVLIISVTASVLLISPSFEKGVVVDRIDEGSPFFEKVVSGDVISEINGKIVASQEDLQQFEGYTGVLRTVINGKMTLVEVTGPGLGILVSPRPFSNLNFGIDIIGGTRVLLEPTENVSEEVVSQALATLQTRINIFGLKEAKFQSINDISGKTFIQIEMAGGSEEEVQELLSKQGVFTATIPRKVNFGNSILGYRVEGIDSDSVMVGSEILKVNDTTVIDGMETKLVEIGDNSAVLEPVIFTGNEVLSVCMQDQPGVCISRVIQKSSNSWEFIFQVFITEEAAQNFARVTSELETVVNPETGAPALDGKIVLYIDEKEFTKLGIATNLAGKAITDPVISGYRSTRDDATEEKLSIQSILQSGALPVKLNTVRVDQISAKLGRNFVPAVGMASIIALAVVGLVVFVRYRNLKLVSSVMLTVTSELIIILGVMAVLKATIDLSAIAGIMAAVGTGVDAQIIIIDELLLGAVHTLTLKQKIKRAMSTIVASASTIIAAMLPLIFIGVGVMRGFGITTAAGITIAVLITRPAFGKIAERVLGRE